MLEVPSKNLLGCRCSADSHNICPASITNMTATMRALESMHPTCHVVCNTQPLVRVCLQRSRELGSEAAWPLTLRLEGVCCTNYKSCICSQPGASLPGHLCLPIGNQEAEHPSPAQVVPHTSRCCPALTVTCSLLGMQQVRELRTLHEERQRDTRLRLLAWQEEVRLRLRAELEARQQEWQAELEARSREEAADLTRKLQVGGVPQAACPGD